MLTFFPTPYPDELLYSVLARYGVRIGCTSPKVLQQHLMGINTSTAVTDLPNKIDKLIESIPVNANYTADGLIYRHTLFPFYAPFLPEKRSHRLMDGMKGDSRFLHYMVGIMASAVSVPRYLRFCQECSQEDFNRYGELYWHRLHQVPGVHVCPIHKTPLSDSTVPYRSENKHEYVPALVDNHMERVRVNRYNDRVLEQLAGIAQDCSWILNQSLRGHEFRWFEKRYSSKLDYKGLISPKGFVYQNSLNEEFQCFFDKETLRILYSTLDKHLEYSWLMSLVQKHRKVFHPIRHILLMRFLAGSVQKFFRSNTAYYPFGVAPWPCLNRIADHYLEPVVNEVVITRCSSTGKPVGTFRCSCGFVYSRRGPDNDDDDRLRIGRIKIFGAVWEARLKKILAKDNIGLREAAREMGCDPKTVIRFAQKLGLTLKTSQLQFIADRKNHKDNCESKKARNQLIWLKALGENPNSSVTELRRLVKGTYIWLYRNDMEWLKENSPKVERSRANKERIDWNFRDEEILTEVKACIPKLYSSNDKPIRISIGRIGTKLGMKALFDKHLDKLPKTNSFLMSVVETREGFQRRRIVWAAQAIAISGEEVKAWKILRIAGIRSEFSHSLQAYIDKQVFMYSPRKYPQGGDNHSHFETEAMAFSK